MNVLMQINKDAFDSRGGDLVQMIETKKSLEKMGHRVNISCNSFEDLSKYDIVHIFNIIISSELYSFYKNAKRQNKPIVISTIYWNRDEYIINNPNFKVLIFIKIFGKKLSLLVMKNRFLFSRDYRKQKEVLKNADHLITTSREEIKLLKNDYKLHNNNFSVIPCGVDKKIFSRKGDNKYNNKFKVENYFLCVGRIENLKNQLSLINFFKKTKYNLVIIGGRNINQSDYWNKCRRASQESNNIFFIDHLEQDMLKFAYSGAIAHIAPGWFETFGMVTLEAIFCGSNVITTENSPMYEYFGDAISYCDPAKLDVGLTNFLRSSKLMNKQIIEKDILDKFDWGKLTREVCKVYEKILK